MLNGKPNHLEEVLLVTMRTHDHPEQVTCYSVELFTLVPSGQIRNGYIRPDNNSFDVVSLGTILSREYAWTKN